MVFDGSSELIKPRLTSRYLELIGVGIFFSSSQLDLGSKYLTWVGIATEVLIQVELSPSRCSHSYLLEFSHDKSTSWNHLPNPLHSSNSHRPHINISTLKTISNVLPHLPTFDFGDDNLVNLKWSCHLCYITCMERFQELSSCTSSWGRTSSTNFRLQSRKYLFYMEGDKT